MATKVQKTDPVVIATYISGDYTKGTARLEFHFGRRSLSSPNQIEWSKRQYSTPEGARRAARLQGYTNLIRVVAKGWDAAAGLLRGAENIARANAQYDHQQELRGIQSLAGRI